MKHVKYFNPSMFIPTLTSALILAFICCAINASRDKHGLVWKSRWQKRTEAHSRVCFGFGLGQDRTMYRAFLAGQFKPESFGFSRLENASLASQTGSASDDLSSLPCWRASGTRALTNAFARSLLLETVSPPSRLPLESAP